MEIQIIDNGVVLATISFADSAQISGAKAPAKTQPKVEKTASVQTEAKASAKKLSKAENKSRYAKLNAQLGVASKASKKGDDQKVALALAKAMELASKPTVWQKDVNRILSKAEEYGLSLS